MKTGRLEQSQTKEEVELMMRKKGLAALMVLCLLLAGCGNSSANIAEEAGKDSQTQTQAEAASDSGTADEDKEQWT